jgi:K+-sensing histidine kinase KdpD
MLLNCDLGEHERHWKRSKRKPAELKPTRIINRTQLEPGAVSLNKDWQILEEIVGSALARLRRELDERSVTLDFPAGAVALHQVGKG